MAGEALNWADRQVATRLEEAMFPPTMDTRDYDTMLAELIPSLAVVTLVSYVELRAADDPDIDARTLIPVEPGTRTVAFTVPSRLPTWLPFVSDSVEYRQVGIEQWTTREIVAWIRENREALGIDPDTRPRGGGEDWWLARVVQQFESQYWEPYGSVRP